MWLCIWEALYSFVELSRVVVCYQIVARGRAITLHSSNKTSKLLPVCNCLQVQTVTPTFSDVYDFQGKSSKIAIFTVRLSVKVDPPPQSQVLWSSMVISEYKIHEMFTLRHFLWLSLIDIRNTYYHHFINAPPSASLFKWLKQRLLEISLAA